MAYKRSRTTKAQTPSKGEETLAAHLAALKIPFDREYVFHPTRKWRFDFIIRGHPLAIEVEGGIHNGRHTRAAGFEADCIKYAEAALMGWTVLRFSTDMVRKGIALHYIEKWLEGR